MGWLIAYVERAETSTDLGTVKAAVVVLERDGAESRVAVELSQPASAAGMQLKPREAVREFLNDNEPPRRLIVTLFGVSVARDRVN